MNIQTGNTYTSAAYSNKGMSGLVSQMDTESMVQAMLSGTQAKIDKYNASRQQTVWKQEIYRSIITKLNTFQNKFFGTTSAFNLRSSSLFNAMKAVTQSSAIRVTAGSTAAAGRTNVDVARLASNASVSGQAGITSEISGTFAGNELSRIVEFDVGGTTKTVDLSGIDPSLSDADKYAEIAQRLTDAGVAATVTDNVLTITGDVKVKDTSGGLGLQMLGLTAGQETVANAMRSVMSPDAKASITLQIDGLQKTIEIDDTYEEGGVTYQATNANGLVKQLNHKLKRAFGEGDTSADTTSIHFETDGTNISLKTPDKGRDVIVSGNTLGMSALGLPKSGTANKILGGMKLSQIAFKQDAALQGNRFKFKINDVEFTFSKDATVNDVVNTINKSDAGVTVKYQSLEDKFVIESKNTGANYTIDMEQSEGNLLSAMFGNDVIKAAANNTSIKQGSGTTLAGSGVNWKDNNATGTFSITVNGEKFSYTLPSKSNGSYTQTEAIGLINTALKEKFGMQTADGEKQKIKLNDDGSFTLEEGTLVEIDAAKEGTLMAQLGYKEAAHNYMTQAAFDVKYGTSSGMTLNSDGTITMNETQYNSLTADQKKKLFGDDVPVFNTAPDAGQFNANKLDKGQNALISVNGVWTERTSNTFTVNGLTMTLLDETGTFKDTAGNDIASEDVTLSMAQSGNFEGESTKIDVDRDTDQIVEVLSSFVEEYNKLIEELNGYVDADTDYKDYPPLTDDQKKEMSDKEIELWEEKSKTGLLRNDSALSTLLQSMRSAMYSRPEGSTIALYDMGIEASDQWREKGKLQPLDESKLKQMLEQDPSAVENLFTNAVGGVANQFNDIISKAANTSSASPGSLVAMAGIKGYASEKNNTLYNRLKDIDDKLERLKDQYESEKNRYWKQFNTMEQYLSNMNTQSAWLTQQLG